MTEEFIDDDDIRCPYCGHTANANLDYELYGEVSQEIDCESCGEEFHVSSSVTVTWTSPPMAERKTVKAGMCPGGKGCDCCHYGCDCGCRDECPVYQRYGTKLQEAIERVENYQPPPDNKPISLKGTP